jgi:hypothetical protein
MFSRIGAEGFAGRARHDLRATGETAASAPPPRIRN